MEVATKKNSKDVIKIIFEVDGGGDIGGESGQRIQRQLNQIAERIKIRVNIDDEHFKSQVDKLQKYIEQKIGKKIKIDLGSAGDGKSAGAGSNIKGQVSAIEDLKKRFKEVVQSWNKLFSVERVKEAYEAQLQRVNRLEDEYSILEQIVKIRAEAGLIDQEQLDELKKYNDGLMETYYVAEALAKDKRLKQPLSFKGAVAQSENIINRYKDLAKYSKEAAAIMDRLGKAARADLSKNPAEAAEQTRNLVQQCKDADAALARLSVQTDTFGVKLRKTFESKILQTFAYTLIGLVTRAISQVYKNVIELDKAVTDLQIATGKTREETKLLVEEYARMARQLGATATQVAQSADTFLRQGYDIADANVLIKNAMMLSKLGQIDAAESARALTSAMKGYKVAVEDTIGIVDKFTAVDMNAAVSAGYIAKAMSETAVSANVAGISMDRLIGYISIVGETTQDAAESVGTFYKTLFARMGNIKAGKFVDDETGESLNDMEKVLGKLGISLRDYSGDFRNFGDVLDEIALKWNGYSDVQKRAIATAAAGTRQQEKFLVLLSNYSKALEYTAVASESAGTAQRKYQEAYLEGIESKIQSLTATWQEFSMALLDSSVVGFVVDSLKLIASGLVEIAKFGDGVLVIIPAILLGITTLSTVLSKIWVAAKSAFPELIGNAKNLLFWTKEQVEAEKERLRLKQQEKINDLKDQAAKLQQEITELQSQANAQNAAQIQAEIELRKEKINVINQEIIVTEHAYKKQMESVKVGIGSWVTLLVTLATSLTMASKNWNKTVHGVISGITAIGGAILALITIIKLFNKTLTFSSSIGLIIAGVAAAIAGIKALIDLIKGPSLQDLKDVASEAKSAFEEVKGELEEVNSRLEETQKRIKELEKIKKPTIVEKQELERLKELNAELGEQQKRLEYQASIKQYASETAAIAVVEKIQRDETGRINKVLSNWGDASLEDKEFVANIISDLAEQAGQIQYKEWSKAGQALEGIWRIQDKFRVAQGETLGDMWTGLLYRENFKRATEALKGLANAGKVTTENLSELRKTNQDVDRFIDYLEELYGVSFDSIENLEALALQVEDLRDSIIDFNVVALTHIEILNKMQGGFDALSNALKDITNLGVLSADSMKKILEEYEGLQKYFKETPFGFVLAPEYTGMSSSEILKDYISGEVQKYTNELWRAQKQLADAEAAWNKELAKAGGDESKVPKKVEEDYEAAKKLVESAKGNLERSILGGEVLLRSVVIEEEAKRLEQQKKVYKDLIDIRKDLLKTFKQELDYQKQLAQKQKSVVDLQTKLRLAQMDTSAYGQSLARELEAQLRQAEEELDEFTLEHAIDILTQQLNDQYNEYDKLIQDQTDRIVEAINELAPLLEKPSPSQQYIDDYYEAKRKQEEYDEKLAKARKDLSDAETKRGKAQTKVDEIKNNPYNPKTFWEAVAIAFNPALASYYKQEELKGAQGELDKAIDKYNAAKKALDDLLNDPPDIPEFHSGGIVGGLSTRKSNEVFAKLTKGEIVVTPTQAQRFINKTLPSITSDINKSVNYNAPLIELNIASATKESIPDIEVVVNRAVDRLKTEINSGIGRNEGSRRIKRFIASNN
jgi:TP901 family phage tail tape measure protein